MLNADSIGGRAALADSLFRIGALRFGKFTLASGKSSPYYLDLRVVPSDPQSYQLAVSAYIALLKGLDGATVDAIAGVATAGVTISSPLAYLMNKPMVYVRKEEKGHGLGKVVEGAVNPGWRTIVVDDLVTTGGSMISAVEALRKEGCTVTDALVLVDRLEGARTNLAIIGVKLHAFTDIRDLVDTLFNQKKVTKTNYEAVLRQMGAP